MKQNRNIIIGFCAIIMAITAITSLTAYKVPVTPIKQTVFTIRVKVLENSTISYVKVTEAQAALLLTYDHIWVNMETHTWDDVDNTAMKCELLRTYTIDNTEGR